MKKINAFLLALALAFTTTACGTIPSSTPDTTSSINIESTPVSSTEKEFHLGYAAPGLSSEYNMMINDGLIAETKKRGIKLDVLSCEGDVSLQVQQVENFITMGVDGILIYPIDAASLADVLKKARDTGIRVVANDVAALPLDSYDVLMSASGFEMGDVCAQAAADWIDVTFPDAAPKSVKVAVMGFWFSELFAARCDVMCDIEKYTDKAVLVEKYDLGLNNYTTAVGEYTEVLLQQHPDIACILSFTDTFAILSDEVFMQKSNLDFSKIGQFTVDRTAECFNRINLSKTDASTIRGTAVPGLDVINDVLDAMQGKLDDKLDDKKTYALETLPVTAETIAEFTK